MNSKSIVSMGFALLMLAIGCAASARPTAVWAAAKTTHFVDDNAHLSLLWEKPIYTVSDAFGNPCTAMGGLLFVVGSEQSSGNLHITAIDREGKTKWSQEGDFHLARSNDQLFIGNGLTITALAPQTGDTNWSAFLFWARHIDELYYFDDKLFVSDSAHPFFVISPDNGNVVREYTSVDGFRSDYSQVPFYPTDNFQPIVLGNDIILQPGKILYSFLRTNVITHNRIWEITDDSISNSALIDNQLFYIAKDDKIKAVDAKTGEPLYDVAIEPSIDFFNLAKDVQHAGYYICSDEDNRVLYVILGDSRQLFAFLVSE